MTTNGALSHEQRNDMRITVQSAADIVSASDFALLFASARKIEQITYASDIKFDVDEFYHLLGFQAGELVSFSTLCSGVNSFFKKQKFSSIDISITNSAEDTASLHFEFSSFWTFARLKISGFLVGKDVYRQYYMMDTGDVFDEDKHLESIEKIKRALAQEGYLNARVLSSSVKDYDAKKITIQLELLRNQKYVISHEQCHITGDIPSDEKNELSKEINRAYLRRLHSAYYGKEKINKTAQEVKLFLADKGFLHVSINLDEKVDHAARGVGLTWEINVHKKRELVFFGNAFFTRYQLCEKISEFGRSAWLLPAGILAEEIAQAYRQNGFWKVEIETREEEGRSFFIIKEKDRFYIDRIELRNVEHFDTDQLIRKFFKKIKRRRFFDHGLLQLCLSELMSFYCEHGFLDARVLGEECVQGDEGIGSLIISIEEGSQYVLGNVRLEGIADVPTNQLFLPYVPNDVPVPFNPTIVAQQRQHLMSHLRKKGYLNSIPRSEVLKKGNSVDISWRIEHEDVPAQFGKSIVLGTSPIPFSRLQKMLLHQTGNTWNQAALRTTFNFLRGLNVFEGIQLVPDVSIENGRRDVLVRLQEDDPIEVRVRAGAELENVQRYQTLEGITYRLGGSFMVKNPLKCADHFRFDVDLTRVHREIVANYILPWSLKIPAKTITKIYSIKHEHPAYLGGNGNIYTALQNGGLVSFQAETDWLDVTCNVGFEWMKTSIKDDPISIKVLADELALAINFDRRLFGESIPYIFGEPTLLIDRLDNKLDPTTGTLTLISMKGMFPIGGPKQNSFFVKMLLEQSLFVPLKQVVLAIRGRVGHIFHRDFSAISPIERFYLGGSHSLRGYDSDLAPPVSVFVDARGQRYLVPRGGKSMLNVNLELRIPFANKFGFTLFQDAGMLSKDNFADFSANNLLAATGFGLRYNTPLGPLRFDIGWKWGRRIPLERSFAWFLSLGNAF
jgi:outer membrane protein assembly factor BamA